MAVTDPPARALPLSELAHLREAVERSRHELKEELDGIKTSMLWNFGELGRRLAILEKAVVGSEYRPPQPSLDNLDEAAARLKRATEELEEAAEEITSPGKDVGEVVQTAMTKAKLDSYRVRLDKHEKAMDRLRTVGLTAVGAIVIWLIERWLEHGGHF